MILAKNDTARDYLGIHPNLDLALERINEEFFATLGVSISRFRPRAAQA